MTDRPALKLELTLEDGEKQEIRWVYGLQQDIGRMVPSPDGIVEAVLMDPYVRDYMVRRALTPLKGIVTEPDEQLIKPEDVLLDPDEQLKLLDWITGHLLYFFANSARAMKARSENMQAEIAPPSLS